MNKKSSVEQIVGVLKHSSRSQLRREPLCYNLAAHPLLIEYRQSGIQVIVQVFSCDASFRKPSSTVLDKMDILLRIHN